MRSKVRVIVSLARCLFVNVVGETVVPAQADEVMDAGNITHHSQHQRKHPRRYGPPRMFE